MNIAAASIIAKTKRDEIMKRLSEIYPEYFWNQNKGYPTKKAQTGNFKNMGNQNTTEKVSELT